MADESFLQPDDDTPVPIQNPEEQMPGLAGYVKTKFEDASIDIILVSPVFVL